MRRDFLVLLTVSGLNGTHFFLFPFSMFNLIFLVGFFTFAFFLILFLHVTMMQGGY